MDEAKKDIGALWVKTAKSGVEFMSGYVDFMGRKVEVVCFRNAKATAENRQPTWRILPSEPRDTGTPGDKVPF